MSTDCFHLSRNEYVDENTGNRTQCCMLCKKTRTYNPNKKKNILVSDPELWSKWVNDEEES